MPSDLLKLLIELGRRYWPKRETIASLTAVLLGWRLYSVIGDDSLAAVGPIEWLSVVLPILFLLGLWLSTTRTPRSQKGRVGIIVSVLCESDESESRFRADFIDVLRQQLLRDGDESKFDLLVYPRHLAEQVQTVEAARKYLHKSRAHFIAFGRVRTRESKKEGFHLLELQGVVRHVPREKKVTKVVSEEFSAALPRKVRIDKEDDVIHLEATSEWLDIAARYVIGMAAAISGDIPYAEALFLSVKASIAPHHLRLPGVRAVVKGLPNWFRDIYRAALSHAIDRHAAKESAENLVRVEEACDKLLLVDPRHYGALLSKARAVFRLRRDTAEARRILMRCDGNTDGTWRYSLAFLYAYEGFMERARAEYSRAFRAHVGDKSVPNQVVEFLDSVAEEEPDKIQLHYCAGIVNLHAQGDLLGAENDFRLFLAGAGSNFLAEQAAARKHLEEIERRQQALLPPVPSVGIIGPGSGM
jgi:hypothetical protein